MKTLKKSTHVLFIGCPNKNDETHLVKSELNKNNIIADNINFTSSTQTRLIYQLIESVSFLSENNIAASHIYSFDEIDPEIHLLLKHTVSHVALLSIFFDNINQYKIIVEFIQHIDKNIKIIVGGGFFVNTLSKLTKREKTYLLKYINADFYIEQYQCLPTIIQLLRTAKQTEINLIPNMIQKISNDYHFGPYEKFAAEFVNNVIDWKNYKNDIPAIASLKTTVSCPYQCYFCAVKQKTERFQLRDISLIQQDLMALKEINRTNIIHFMDETINLPPSRFKKLLQMLINNRFDFSWYSFFRLDKITDEIARLMKKSGCLAVLLGMESGNNNILTAMNKKTTRQEMEKAHKILKNHGIITFAFFIVGFPGDTDHTILDTIDFINKIQPTFYKIHIWECDVGSEIWRKRDAYNLQMKNGIWKHSTMSLPEAKEKIEQAHSRIKCSCNIDNADFSFALQMIKADIPLPKIFQIYKNISEDGMKV